MHYLNYIAALQNYSKLKAGDTFDGPNCPDCGGPTKGYYDPATCTLRDRPHKTANCIQYLRTKLEALEKCMRVSEPN
jgi:hypothetical protein